MRTAAIMLVAALVMLLIFQLGRLYETERHETCFCDTCVELHYEAIRRANPDANLPPID